MTAPVGCLALMTDAFGGHGGIAQYNRDFAGALSRASAGSIEILPRHAPEPLTPLPDNVVQRAPRAGRLAYAGAALAAARRTRPAMVFCGHLHFAPLAALAARTVGARLVVQTHGIEAWTRPSAARRAALQSADLVLAVSRDTRDRVLSWSNLSPDRVQVAPNTVDEAFHPGPRERERWRLGGAFALLTVGRLAAAEGYKGHDRVIAELPRLRAEGFDVVYLVAGDGDDRPRLERMASDLQVADQVRFLGRVPAADLPSLYRAADLFVLPSSGEGFGIVLLEAMACGTPALGLAVGGAVDALDDGRLGSAVAVEEFGPALRQAVAQPARDPTLPERVQARFGRAAFDARIAELAAPLTVREERRA